MELSQLHFLAEFSSKPTIILSSSGEVLAANNASARLFSLDFKDANKHPLIACSIFNLGIMLLPGKKPIYRNLETLLEAAAAQKRAQADSDVQMADSDSRHQSTDPGTAFDHSFWDEEDKLSIAQRIDVIIPRPITTFNSHRHRQGDENTSSVRAHLRLQPILLHDKLFFKLTFRRPTMDHLSFIPTLRQRGELDRETCPEHVPHAPTDVLQDLKTPVTQGGLCEHMIGRLIPHCAGIMDADGQVVYLSPSWYDFTGATELVSLGTEWAQLVHPDDREGMLKAWSDVLEFHYEKWTYEARYRMRDGTYRYFLVRAQPYMDENGKILRWYSTMLDVNDAVSDRKEKEQRKQSMFNLLSAADVSLWGVTQEHEMYVRAGALSWDPFQSPPQSPQATAQNNDAASDTDMAEDDVADVIQSILDGDVSLKTLEHQVGERWYRTRIVADLDQHPGFKQGKSTVRAALGLTIDVTDVRMRTSLEIENERLLTSAAKEASRLKSQFLANMSHEIRTPIAGIIGLAELLAEPVKEQERQELLTSIQQSANFLLMLINDILDFSKIESGHMEIETVPFEPSKIIDDLRVLMGVQAKDKGLKLICDNPLEENVSVVGDPGRLRQILTNLLSNSIKFTSKGSVTLSVKVLRNDASMGAHRTGKAMSPSPIGVDSSKDILQFVVQDTGCGINDESMRKLFQPFSQADASTARTHGGTGLGLSISRQLVELMGGTIELNSEPCAGTTATVQIPYSYAAPPTKSRIGSPSDSLELPRPDMPHSKSSEARRVAKQAAIHVLVVEDNPVNQKIAVAKVRKLGHGVSAVWNGEEALAYLDAVSTRSSSPDPSKSSNNPLPSIVLMDCMMPVMDGYEATQILRKDRKRFDDDVRQVPVVAMTASAVQGEREKCEVAGMDDYLTKPVNQDILEKMIQKWVVKKRKADGL